MTMNTQSGHLPSIALTDRLGLVRLMLAFFSKDDKFLEPHFFDGCVFGKYVYDLSSGISFTN